MVVTPAAAWMQLDPDHPAIARAFGLPQDAAGARFALYPFRVNRIGGVWHVLAAWPCPRTIGALDTDASGVLSVIAWNPADNTHRLVKDPQPQLVGRVDINFNGNSAVLYGNGLQFFRAWIANRLAYWRNMRTQGLGVEPDLVPGALVVGDLREIRLPLSVMPPAIHCVGVNPGAVNRRIVELAQLPQASAKVEALGAAA